MSKCSDFYGIRRQIGGMCGHRPGGLSCLAKADRWSAGSGGTPRFRWRSADRGEVAGAGKGTKDAGYITTGKIAALPCPVRTGRSSPPV